MAPNIGYEIKATATPAGLKITQTKRTINSQPKRTRSHLRFAPQCLSPTWGELETMPNGNSVAPARPNSHSQSPSFPLHCDQINNKPPQNKAAKGAGIPLKSNVSWSPSGFFEVAWTENRASRQAAAITTVNGNNVAQAHPGGRTPITCHSIINAIPTKAGARPADTKSAMESNIAPCPFSAPIHRATAPSSKSHN